MINFIKKQSDNKLCISIDNEINVLDKPIQSYFNDLLTKQLTNLYTREKQTKKHLKFKSKIPIYIDESNLYLCIKSYRLEQSFYINYFAVISYEVFTDYTIVNFRSNHSIKIKGVNTFKSQLKKSRDILNFMS